MQKIALTEITAVELRDRLASGALSAESLAGMYLELIAAREPQVQAWQWLDAEFVLAEARKLDQRRQSGAPIGPLHGLPIAVKDVIDTAGIPTENGTVLDAGRVPADDAELIGRLKAAGALIMGKTVTAELAFLHPGKTRNPVNPEHTPGGSSSGSAAAVAAGMVPLAVGTQTGGSIIRPAAYCGTVGFKPTFGCISRTGVLKQSPSLDTIGVFARTVEDAGLLADVLFGHDLVDTATIPRPFPRLLATASSEVPAKPVFAFVRTPFWDQAEPEMQQALEELVDFLGEQCFEVPLDGMFADSAAARQRINIAEMAKNFHHYEKRGVEALSSEMRAAMDAGNKVPARDYLSALDLPAILDSGLNEVFERCDAILTPATTGAAPATLDSTGNSIFNGLWTLCGNPCVTLPVFDSENGLPMGVQLVGRRFQDGRLLRTARWLSDRIANPDGS
ncbi:amidase [Granulosicoccus antarcticus]|uniref:Amidase AmiD n=1 Tax=Granulosicoccus antarcticus IMCC3135 TaxID=1192854 RepID=A0A2Z2NYJ1_9GAMM|nr:amidase [Granulosicoccus antarcticus]ASJ76389.1 Putative amidase AmiD [Granulosicoccus antarcticus IMCC3135]